MKPNDKMFKMRQRLLTEEIDDLAIQSAEAAGLGRYMDEVKFSYKYIESNINQMIPALMKLAKYDSDWKDELEIYKKIIDLLKKSKLDKV